MNSEQGHAPNRFYGDQQGNLHLNGSALYLDELGNQLTSAQILFPGPAIIFASEGTVAAAGANQSSAAALIYYTNFVSGVSGTNGVRLPTPTQAGQRVEVINGNNLANLLVYPDNGGGGTGGSINGGSANSDVTVSSGKGVTYVCTGVSPSAWWSLSN